MEKINLKKIAAEKAVEEIKPGMVVGLGTGSTFQFALERIAEKIKSGELYNIVCIPSSDRTEAEAKRLGIPLTSFEEQINTNSQLSAFNFPQIIDVTIDGADEVTVSNPELVEGGEGSINVIKGGAALY
jgi:ribose 5-phosphate isomerase A